MDARTSIPRKRPTGWAFAFTVFIAIGLGTTVIAIRSYKQQADSDRVRFNEEAGLLDQALSDDINDAIVAISQISHYLGQTLDTSSPAQFDQFIEGSGFEETYPALRNGLLVVELIDDADLPRFLARERRFDPDFEIRPMVEGYDGPTSWVVTRATKAESFGVNLLGADISQLGLALPGYLPTEDQPISTLPPSAFGAIVGAADDPDWENLVNRAATGQFRQIILRWIPGEDGRPVGLLFASLDDDVLWEELESKFRSDIDVRVQLITDGATARPVPAAQRAAHSTSREILVEGTRWHLTTWAGDRFASTDSTVTAALLAIGWIFAAIVSVVLLLRYRGLGELEDIQQELAVTSELAGSDPLTGLINRSEMLGNIESALDSGESVGLLFLDMDRFKLVNDTLGHDAGDELLKAVANRISETVRTSDSVARFGGDEFVVLLRGVKTINEATATAEAIQERIHAPLMLGKSSFHPASSIGVAIAAESMFVSPAGLLRQADTAMYDAKRSRQSGIAVFDASMREAAVDRLALEQELYIAVSDNQMACRFQPIVDAYGSVAAYEALVFWEHPTRGTLPLSSFAEIARQAGLISDVANQALAEVCVEISLMEATLPIHLNIDPHVLSDPGFGNRVQVISTQIGISPNRLVIEISEQGLSAGTTQLHETLKYLSNYGVRFAIDGFGGGQTSLSLLTRLEQLSMVKIDRGMVRDVVNDGRMSPVIEAIVGVAQSLGFVVAAEGIETESDRQCLLGLGIERTQGPLYGAPRDKPVSCSLADRHS